MNKLLIAAASAGVVLTAGAAMAQPYHHDRDYDHSTWHDRDWRDQDWRDHARRDNDDWRWRHRHYYGRAYGYGHQVCAWRYGERACWYQRW